MSEPSLDLCISIVSGSNPQMTVDCLRSLFISLTGALKVEVHFVDNASPSEWFEGVEQMSPLLRVHRNERRLGFGANHNQIMSTVDARFYLLLNDDTHIYAQCCEKLVEAAERNPRAGFVGARLFNADGSIQPSVYRFPSPSWALCEALLLNKLLPFLKCFDDYRHFSYEQERFVDYVSGAAILVRKETLKEIGMFDERFFMYAEETDWCMRGSRAGWLTLYTPKSRLVHYGGQCSVNVAPERSVEFLRSHTRFLEKHFSPVGRISYRLLNLIKHFPRMAVAKLIPGSGYDKMAETDIVLWSLGALNRPGLQEIADSRLYAASSASETSSRATRQNA